MPTTTRAPRATPATRERTEHNADVLSRLQSSLEVAQADLASLRGSLGAGARDLRRDLARLLRDARADVTKMSRLVLRDLERLQRDVSAAAAGKPAPSAGRRPARRRARPAARARAGS